MAGVGEIVKGKIIRWEPDGGVLIRAAVPNIDRALLRKYDDCLCEFQDGRRISPEQRRKCYALINEISLWVGEYPELMKKQLKLEFAAERLQTIGSKIFSLSDCDVTLAREFLSYLLDFMIIHGVPSKIPLYEQAEDIGRFVYCSLINKRCAVCGKHADVHHLHGSRDKGGLQWRQKDQAGAKVLPLCREHHSICHGDEEGFLARYHLEGVEMTRELAKKYKAKITPKK